MRKDELRKLRTLNVTQGMITRAKNPEDRTEFFARAQCLGKYIKFAIFKAKWILEGKKTPRAEIFVNPEGKEWITRILNEKGEEDCWSDAMIYNLPIYLYYYRVKTWTTADTFETLQRLCKDRNIDRNHCMTLLWDWQQDIRRQRIEEQEKKEQKPWDEDMALIPKIPAGLQDWMHRQCCSKFFLIYEYQKNQKIAYCSRCGTNVRVDGLKYQEKKTCPKCKAKCICIPSGFIKSRDTGCYHARVIQKIEGGIVERLFEAREMYRGEDYRKPKVYMREYERILIRSGQQPKKYGWGMYKNKYLRWCHDKDWNPQRFYRFYGYEHACKMYPPTMREAMKTDVMKKTSYMLWENPPLILAEYLILEQCNPCVEMLARVGMFTLADDMIRGIYDKDLLKENATELTKMLKIDGARLKRLRAMPNAGLTALKWMQREKQSDCIWPDEMIGDFDHEGIEPKKLFFLPHKQMTELQIWNYLKKQAVISGETMYQLVGTWNDYLSMAGTMKMDVNNSMIFKPKDLKHAHDELVMLKNTKNMEAEAKKIEKKWPKVNKQLQKLKKFEYKLGDYQIVAPAAVIDIVKEGRVLQHCVHTCEYYFSRIQSDESYLFFLRRSKYPDMPWYTLEVEPSGNIRQKRTTGDRQNKDFDDALEFLKKWQQYFKKKLTKKEKELGTKSDELRKKQYAELRQQAKTVWHGPLAGQLLADVLEKDFMEAM